MAKGYDPECEKLAEYFLDWPNVHPERQGLIKSDNRVEGLSQAIQDAVEDWMEMNPAPLRPKDVKLVSCALGHRSTVPVDAIESDTASTHTCPVCGLGVSRKNFETIPEKKESAPDRPSQSYVCECGFSATTCSTNPCLRKKVHLAGLTPGSKWPAGAATGSPSGDPQTDADTRLILAEEYDVGLRRMEAFDHKEFSDAIWKYKIVIDALRRAANDPKSVGKWPNEAPLTNVRAPDGDQLVQFNITADENWNRGCDFALEQLCKYLGVEQHNVLWDAATETVEGDVTAVIGNIFRAKYGDDWNP